MAFNRVKFLETFAASLDMLRQSEQVTKRELRELSRSVLDALHNGDDGEQGKLAAIKGDIQFVNTLMNALTPINRKVAVLYFQHFTGFHFDVKENRFTKKDGKRYLTCVAASAEFLAEPGNNLWTWAERNIVVEPKPFDLKKVTQFIDNALKKTNQDELGVLRAVLDGGVKVGTIIALMHQLGIEAARQPAEIPAAGDPAPGQEQALF